MKSTGPTDHAYTCDGNGNQLAQSSAQGFTGHTSLDHLELVHMGGRMYDPVLGRFLSPDPYVQFPESIQGFNRYTYVNNNPLSYVGLSGYFSLKKAFKGIGKWFNRVVKKVGE